MKRQDRHQPSDRQRRYMQLAEDHFELLDDIRDMIDIELERRGVGHGGATLIEGAPPRGVARAAHDPPPRCSLRRLIMRLFSR